jgi:mRNA interferase HigB
VRVVARGTLNGFVRNRVACGQQAVVKAQLDAWYKVASKAGWSSSAELKKQVRSASVLTAERVVFNIKGNGYRLITVVNYVHQILFVKWLGTHEEYDAIIDDLPDRLKISLLTQPNHAGPTPPTIGI